MGDWTKEPWEFDFFNLKATHEIWPSSSHPEAEPIVVLDPRDYERATNCVNAMCGIPDPAKFVEAAKALRNAVRCEDHDKFQSRCDGVNPVKAVYGQCETCHHAGQFDKALAAKPEEE